MKTIDLIGKQFGKWTVIEKAKSPNTQSPSKPLYWRCKCECGNENNIPAHNLRCNKSTSCGCTKNLPPYVALYNFLLRMSARSNKICNLTIEEFIYFTSITNCHYCHAPIQWTKHNLGNGGSYQLDRKDNSLGYTKDNCVVCCKRCNFAKGNRYTYSEWYLMNECFRSNN